MENLSHFSSLSYTVYQIKSDNKPHCLWATQMWFGMQGSFNYSHWLQEIDDLASNSGFLFSKRDFSLYISNLKKMRDQNEIFQKEKRTITSLGGWWWWWMKWQSDNRLEWRRPWDQCEFDFISHSCQVLSLSASVALLNIEKIIRSYLPASVF